MADTLRALGYPVSAWTRTLRSPAPEGIACYHGAEQLQAFASAVDVLVCLLPLTDATRGILDARLFSWLPPGAAVINAARGGHCVDADLLAALDSGHVSWAAARVRRRCHVLCSRLTGSRAPTSPLLSALHYIAPPQTAVVRHSRRLLAGAAAHELAPVEPPQGRRGRGLCVCAVLALAAADSRGWL